MSHITGSCVVFYFFYRFFSGKFNVFTRPHPISHTFCRIYWRFILPYPPNIYAFTNITRNYLDNISVIK